MAQNSGFFDSTRVVEDVSGFPRGDKAQNAAFLARINDTFYSNGVAKTDESDFQVVADGVSGGKITVKPGFCMIDGYVAYDDDPEPLYVEFSTETQNLVVVQRLDLTTAVGAAITKMIVPATVSPIHTETVHDIWLAKLSIPGGAVHIDQSMITDMRGDSTVCGWIYAPLAKMEEDTFPDFVKLGATQIARNVGGTGAAYTATVDAFSADDSGKAIRFVPHVNSAPGATLKLNQNAAYPIYSSTGRAVNANELAAGIPVDLIFYNGKYFFKSGGAGLNILYSPTPPPKSDSLWVKTSAEATGVEVRSDLCESVTVNSDETYWAEGEQAGLTTDGTLVYGQNGGRRVLIQSYNPATKTWSVVVADYASGGKKYFCKPAYKDGWLYYFSRMQSAFYRHNLSTNTSSALPASPGTNGGGLMAYGKNEILSFASGSIYAFNIDTLTWSVKASSFGSESTAAGIFKAGKDVTTTALSGGGYHWDGQAVTRNKAALPYSLDTNVNGLADPTFFPVEARRLSRLYTSNGSGALTSFDPQTQTGRLEKALTTSRTDGEWGACSPAPVFIGNTLYTGSKYSITVNEPDFAAGTIVVLCRGDYNPVTLMDSPSIKWRDGLAGVFYKPAAGSPLQELPTYLHDGTDWVLLTCDQNYNEF